MIKLPKLIKVVTKNIEVGQGGGRDVSAKTILSYALLAYSLPPGHIFQSRIEGLEGFSDLTTAPENIQRAVREFANPDVESPRKATAVALGEKVKQKSPPLRDTTVAVLNGNGVSGSASTANYLLGQRGYSMVLPPNGVPANAPTFDYFRSTVYFDPRRAGATPAAKKLANLFGSADVKRDDAGCASARATARCSSWSWARPSTVGSRPRPSTRPRNGRSRTSRVARTRRSTSCGQRAVRSTSR